MRGKNLGLWNIQVFADFSRDKIDDLAMSGNGGRLLRTAIDVNRVVAALRSRLVRQ
jgi:hypothetical protein